MADEFSLYRPWFGAAVIYNLTWGISVVIHPRWYLWFAGLGDAAAPLAQGIGMMVGVYAFGYYLLLRNPARYAPFIWIALAGKTLGAIGCLGCVIAGTLPARFAWQTVMNDLVWLPAFFAFALRHARSPQ